jgi:iron complex transport system substrate-binding protein
MTADVNGTGVSGGSSRRTRRGAVAVLAALAIAMVGCGSDGAGGASSADSTPASGATEASATSTGSTTPQADATAFPVTIEHKFGDTTIEAEPERVVSIGFNEHDFLLAIGVVPVALRDWYGEQPNSVWPWAQDELGGATPEVLPADALNFEQIAALEPDLIVGVWSGMTAEDYELLAAIAPTVAQPDTYDDFGTPWQEQTMILGEATGHTVEAEAVVADLEGKIADARDSHPEWAGLTSSVAFVFDGVGPGAYTSQDTRSRFMQNLGFEIPAVNGSGGEGSFYTTFSTEDITALDADALVWVIGDPAALDAILGLPTRTSLVAYTEGREIFADVELSGAFSHGSPLSLEYVLERMVPELEAAVDGDPATAVPSAAAIGAAAEDLGSIVSDPAEPAGSAASGSFGGADADAAAEAWSTVFDSTVAFDVKAPFLADASALQATVEAYEAAGEAVGGISLAPSAVIVDGGTAVVTYDVNFGPNPAYTGQEGTIDLIDGVWVVSRDAFCGFMSSARVACP